MKSMCPKVQAILADLEKEMSMSVYDYEEEIISYEDYLARENALYDYEGFYEGDK